MEVKQGGGGREQVEKVQAGVKRGRMFPSLRVKSVEDVYEGGREVERLGRCLGSEVAG